MAITSQLLALLSASATDVAYPTTSISCSSRKAAANTLQISRVLLTSNIRIILYPPKNEIGAHLAEPFSIMIFA
jgi:hypothetical protein